MSVSSVSQRAVPQAVQQQPAREPVKAPTKEPHDARPVVREKPSTHEADLTYAHAKEKSARHTAPKGQQVDIKA